MAINLITGKPGHGKTLNTIREVRDRAKLEGRAVGYSNIKGLSESLGWHEMTDPLSWFDSPVGAILLFDECQDFFPKRPAGSKVPRYVFEFNVHRHSGFDIYLITQSPRLLDERIRELVETHIHYFRPMGWKRSRRLEWASVQLDPYKNAIQKDALSSKTIKFDPKLFDLYTSSQKHTVRPRFPYKLFLPIPLLVILGFLIYFIYHKTSNSVPDSVKIKQEPQKQYIPPPSTPQTSPVIPPPPVKKALAPGRIVGHYGETSRTVFMIQDQHGYHRIPASYCKSDFVEYVCTYRDREYLEGVTIEEPEKNDQDFRSTLAVSSD